MISSTEGSDAADEVESDKGDNMLAMRKAFGYDKVSSGQGQPCEFCSRKYTLNSHPSPTDKKTRVFACRGSKKCVAAHNDYVSENFGIELGLGKLFFIVYSLF